MTTITLDLTEAQYGDLAGWAQMVNPFKRIVLEPTPAQRDSLRVQLLGKPPAPAFGPYAGPTFPVESLSNDDLRYLANFSSYHPGRDWFRTFCTGEDGAINAAINQGALLAPGFDLASYQSPLRAAAEAYLAGR